MGRRVSSGVLYVDAFSQVVQPTLLLAGDALTEKQDLGFGSITGKRGTLYSYDPYLSVSYHLGKCLPKCSTPAFSNILVSAPFISLKINADAKKLLFVWAKSTNMYHIRTEN